MDELFDKERQRLLLAIGYAIESWQGVEFILARIYHQLLDCPPNGRAYAMFSSLHMNDKLKQLRALVEVGITDTELKSRCQHLLGDADKLSRKRNNIVHWFPTTGWVAPISGELPMGLLRSFLDPRCTPEDIDPTKHHPDFMTLEELSEYSRDFRHLQSQLAQLWLALPNALRPFHDKRFPQ